MSAAELLFLFLVAHAVCDIAVQGEAMGTGKSRRASQLAPRADGFPPWYAWLVAHGLTHGGAVYLVSGQWILGAAESALHAAIDHQKCEGRLTFLQDQALHVACKLVYVAILVGAAGG